MARLSISKAWDETRGVLRSDGRLFVAIAAALLVVPGVASQLITPPAPPNQMPPLGPWTAVTVAALVIALIGQLAMIRLASGARLTVGEAIVHGAKRAPAYIAATLIWIAPFALVLALLAPNVEGATPSPAAASLVLLMAVIGLFFAVRMIMSSAVATNEDQGPLAILKRSWLLTRGHWWRLFATLLLLLIVAGVLILAENAVIGSAAQLLLGGSEPWTVGALLIALVDQVTQAAVSVVFAVLLARIYLQLSDAEASSVTGVPNIGS